MKTVIVNPDQPHTPTPWVCIEHADSSGIAIGTPYSEKWMKDRELDDGTIEKDAGFRTMDTCTISGGRRNGVTDEMRANAAYIVLCANQHEALLNFIQRVELACSFPDSELERALRDEARKTLALVGVEPTGQVRIVDPIANA